MLLKGTKYYAEKTEKNKMKTTTVIYKVAIAVTFLLFATGCSNYGKIVKSDEDNDRLSIYTLENTWEKYTVYYTWTRKAYHALLFDPKEGKQSLIVRRWIQIKDKETLSRVIADMNNHRYRPAMYNMVGPKGHPYGYVYSTKGWIIAKAIDDTTMQVYDFPPPPDR